MSAKKRVQFDDSKKTYKKYAREENDDDDDSDDQKGFYGETNDDDDESTNKKKAKHSLDSDEEDDSEKYDVLSKHTLSDIGQEAKTIEFDDNIKVTPFNMKEELEDGNFDMDGYYHWKSRNKDEVQDAWLDNIDWANINSFKYRAKNGKETDNMKVDGNQFVDDKSDNEESDDDDGNNDDESKPEDFADEKESSRIDMFKKILVYLKPNETVLKAIKRLGKSGKSANNSASLSASQRWCKKKNKSNDEPAASASNDLANQSALVDKEAVEKLTGFANHFIDRGFYDIYDETYEKLKYKVEQFEKSEANKNNLDIFADEIDEDDLKKKSDVSADGQASTENNLIEDKQVKWVYKIENKDDADLHGPYSSQQMLDMSSEGKFPDAGVWCRMITGESSSSSLFYNSKRLDFDLYT